MDIIIIFVMILLITPDILIKPYINNHHLSHTSHFIGTCLIEELPAFLCYLFIYMKRKRP